MVNLLPLSGVSGVLVVGYCGLYGIGEVRGATRPAPPGSRWQVPQSLVAGSSGRRRVLTWGAILGPGFATRNPYAGFGLLVLVVAAVGHVGAGVAVAAAIGVAHGTGRALALLRDAHGVDASEYLHAVLRAMRWRTVDGVILLVIGSVTIGWYLAHH